MFFRPDPRIDKVIALLNSLIDLTTKQGAKTVATLADIQAAVAAEKTVEDGIITLLTEVANQLQAALKSNDPVAMQSIVDMIHANTAVLSAAVVANVPPAAPAASVSPSTVVTPPPPAA
jgi:hypothetical protein